MEEYKKILKSKEFHLFLFFVCFFLFSWPILTMASTSRIHSLFIYLFLAWGLIIVILFFMSRSLEHQEPDMKEKEG